ncbi:MAG: RsmD family RNA methyltransferase, partial [Pseudobdellovibrionaceae bacterium]
HPKSIEILKKNIAKLRISEPFTIVNRDVVSFLKNYSGEAFDLVLADPPFTEEMAHEVMIAASQSSVFGQSTIMTIESGPKEKIEGDYNTISRYDLREFGDKTLSFFATKPTE